MKKILLILFMILVTAGIAYALYVLFFKPPAEEVPPEVNVNVPVTGLPPAAPGAPPVGVPVRPEELPPTVPSPVAAGGLTQVTPVIPIPTVGATLSRTGDLNYYNRADGKFYRINPDGTTDLLTNKAFFNVREATFDPSGDKAILEYPDGANIYYDFATNTQVTLPKHWEEFDFSTEGDRIVAKSIGIDENNRFIVVSNPDGSGARAVQELGQNADKVDIDWSPNNQIIATATTGRKFGVDRQEVYFLGQNQENFKSMVVEGLDFRPQWAPSGQQLLYSVAGSLSDWKPNLWIVDAQGDDIGRNRRSINVKTWADKCTFANDDTVYCAVPRELPRGAGLQPAVAADTPDDLFKIDLNTGLQTLIAIPEGDHTIGKLMLAQDGGTLFFSDSTSGTLNKVQLQP